MIVGVDEVGRGCWAGPIVAGAVILGPAFPMPTERLWKLGDSKLLSRSQREIADIKIRELAVEIGLGWVEASEIDALGLTEAVRLAMHRAVGDITTKFDQLVVDGQYNFFPDEPRAQAIIKADATVAEVSAASIVAKVARDNWMTTVAARQFPGYHFEQHVGYGTRLHRSVLQLHGICALHRRSFRPMRGL